jgi:hypothetical protein
MATLLSHFYNEEYLLPFWLNHHKKYFETGIMINYGSTDKSVEIIKDICPDWKIVNTRYPYFYAPWIDVEVVDYEREIQGYRICLNTTEFLLGNFHVLENSIEPKQHIIREHIMVDSPEQEFTDIKEDLIKERQFGIHRLKVFEGDRGARSLHNYLIDYPSVTGPGRHFMRPTCPCDGIPVSEDFIILWYGYAPFNDKLVKRKLQIQTKHHPNGQWTGGHNIDEMQLINAFKQHQAQSEDLSQDINRFLK